MRRWLLTLALVLAPVCVSAQIIHGGSGSGGVGFSTPGAGVIVDTDGAGALAARTITAGSGISIANGAGAAGNPTISLDTSFAAIFSSGTGAVSGTGAIGSFYFETDANRAFFYPSTDTEHQILSIAPGALAWGDVFFIDTNLVPKRLAAGTSGQVLQTNGAGADPSWVTASSFDPSTTFDVYEDFISGGVAAVGTGGQNLDRVLVATGTLTQVSAVGTSNPGLIRLNSHAANDNSGVAVYFGGVSATINIFGEAVWSDRIWSLDGVVKLGSNSTAITATSFYFGLTNATGGLLGAGTSGIWIKRDTDESNTAFVFAVCNSSTSGCASAGDDTAQKSALSTVTPVAGDFHRFRIRHDPTAGPGSTRKIWMRVDSETEVTFCSSGCDDTLATVPATTLMFVVAYLTETTTSVMSADLDYLHLRIEGLVRN